MGNILVVDDDEDLVETYKLALTGHGHVVQSAYSAAQARELLKKSRPDAAVLDVMMETKGSGFELAREIQRLYPRLPVVLLTSVHQAVPHSFHFEPDESWLPVAKFLDKPVDPEILAKEVDGLISR